MPRSFNLRSFSLPAQLSNAGAWKEPRVLVRLVLGLLLIANLVAAGFAFNVFGPSPEGLNQSLVSAEAQLQSDQARLTRTRVLASKIGKGKTEGDTFLTSYFTNRRNTYSTIITEITDTARTAGMKTQEGTIAPLDPIEGSDELSMMTISINFEGTFPQLVKFVNLLDRSPRFLIIESMQVAPQPKGDVLNTNFKLHVFVRDDPNAAL
ncbi:MAG TPA: GspMb/PilO family protein [Bryobacteraceae bacterium]|jgi:type IV pilus assembly protein PilO|nr:GspMb/PilO family protein [Bryobacteraceae bacterium]